ncbi:MAG: succinate dehydrogenase cytochrome b subunit [Candidatus Zixiibacteriota bacterium]
MSTAVTSRARSLPGILITSSVGKKILMAVTGFVSFGYVVGHMAGNLQIFVGQDRLNAYAEALHSLGAMLWLIRLFLLACIVIHIWMGIQLKLENWSARPVGYRKRDTVQASLASRTMIWTGLLIGTFVVYHLLHFTVRTTDPRFADLVDSLGRYDVYSMVILGFRNLYISGFYIVAVGLLCYHLSHGIASMFQTIGWCNERVKTPLERISMAVSTLIFLGYISVPIAVLAGVVKLPGEV